MAERVHVMITGRVQGVGFRYATAREAERLGLHGWVRNCPNGRVEAEFEGDRAMLEAMVSWCGHGPTFALVDSVDTTWESGAPKHKRFSVR